MFQHTSLIFFGSYKKFFFQDGSADDGIPEMQTTQKKPSILLMMAKTG